MTKNIKTSRPYSIDMIELAGAVISILVAVWTIYQYDKGRKQRKK